MRATRAEPGCLEYAFSPDPVEPGRIIVLERWATQQEFEAHIAAAKARPPKEAAAQFKAASVFVYSVTGERPLGP